MGNKVKRIFKSRFFAVSFLVYLLGALLLGYFSWVQNDFLILLQVLIVGALVLLLISRLELINSSSQKRNELTNGRLSKLMSISTQNMVLTRQNLERSLPINRQGSVAQESSVIDFEETEILQEPQDSQEVFIESKVELEEPALKILKPYAEVFEEFLTDIDKNFKSGVSGLSPLQVVSLRREIALLDPQLILTTFEINDGSILHTTAEIKNVNIVNEFSNLKNYNQPTVVLISDAELKALGSAANFEELNDIAFVVSTDGSTSGDVNSLPRYTEVVPSGAAFNVKVFVPLRLAL